ncbi:D-glycero-beta-D-manno-heptose-7-phosphate kinase [candidate division KSB1 bacterium]
MIQIQKHRLKQLLNACKNKKAAVVGDIMLDRYIWGSVSRISPEAPVPVVEVSEESSRIGGAANVANNIHSLGGVPLLFGVIGDDVPGNDLKEKLAETKMETFGIVTDKTRPTTMKTRIIAHNQHVVRTDFELKNDIAGDIADNLLNKLEGVIKELSIIILQDYNKGVLTQSCIERIISLAKEHGCPVTVDPKFNNFFEFRDVTLFKPNIKETQSALGFILDSEERIAAAGKLLIERLNSEHVLITRGSAGMSLFSQDGFSVNVPAKAKNIADVSGAGDTVISVLSMILAAGGDMLEAATVANYAAGIVVGEVGIVPVELDTLEEAITNDG